MPVTLNCISTKSNKRQERVIRKPQTRCIYILLCTHAHAHAHTHTHTPTHTHTHRLETPLKVDHFA